MKITIVLGAFFPVPPIMGGAVEKQWFTLGKEFAKQGHELVQISRAMSQLPATEMIDGVRHLRVRGYDAPRSLAWLKFLDLLYSWRVRRVLPHADILVTNTFWLPMLRPPASSGKIYVHVARMPKGQMRLYSHATRLQAVSEPVAQAIVAEEPALAPKVTTIPNGLPDELAETDVPPLSARENVVLYVGRIHPEKGMELLIDAFCMLRSLDWRLVFVGPFEEAQGGGGAHYVERLEQRATAAGAHAEFLGPVFDEAELAPHYRRAKIFAYPSIAQQGESFGVAPLEAMANGCAVVVSQLACFAAFVQPEQNALVFDHRTANAASELAMQLRQLMADPAIASRVATAGKATAHRFAISEIAARYLRDFDQLLAPCS
jgi:glycosyltransferase involved in cell wall biosynthesis